MSLQTAGSSRSTTATSPADGIGRRHYGLERLDIIRFDDAAGGCGERDVKESAEMVMTERFSTKSAEIRSKLDYPVVDCDGHIQEMVPVMEDYVRDVAGADVAKEWIESHRDPVTADRPGQRKGG